MKANNGLAPAEQLRTNVCEQSPFKKQFTTLAAAQEQADYDNRKYPKQAKHSGYACPSCGLFHVTSRDVEDLTAARHPDGRLVLPRANVRKDAIAAGKMREIAHLPTQRIDMTDIIARDKPVVPANRAAREKFLQEYLQDKPFVKMAEIVDLLQMTNQGAGDIMRAMGWVSVMGTNARWIRKDDDPLNTDEVYQKVAKFLSTRTTTTIKAVAAGTGVTEKPAKERMVQAGWGRDGKSVIWRPIGDKVTVTVPQKRKGSHAGTVPAEVKARRKKLERYLKDHPNPTTDELLEITGANRHVIQKDMAILGWWVRKGRGATWAKGERPLHLVESPPEEAPDTPEEPPVSEPAATQPPDPAIAGAHQLADGIDRHGLEAVGQAVAALDEPAPLELEAPAALDLDAPQSPPVVVDDDGWRDMADLDRIQNFTLKDLCKIWAAAGLEVRIQAKMP